MSVADILRQVERRQAFNEVRKSGGDDGGGKITKRVAELRKKNPKLTEAVARAIATKELRKAKGGLVQKKVWVHPKTGKPFQQNKWVSPDADVGSATRAPGEPEPGAKKAAKPEAGKVGIAKEGTGKDGARTAANVKAELAAHPEVRTAIREAKDPKKATEIYVKQRFDGKSPKDALTAAVGAAGYKDVTSRARGEGGMRKKKLSEEATARGRSAVERATAEVDKLKTQLADVKTKLADVEDRSKATAQRGGMRVVSSESAKKHPGYEKATEAAMDRLRQEGVEYSNGTVNITRLTSKHRAGEGFSVTVGSKTGGPVVAFPIFDEGQDKVSGKNPALVGGEKDPVGTIRTGRDGTKYRRVEGGWSKETAKKKSKPKSKKTASPSAIIGLAGDAVSGAATLLGKGRLRDAVSGLRRAGQDLSDLSFNAYEAGRTLSAEVDEAIANIDGRIQGLIVLINERGRPSPGQERRVGDPVPKGVVDTVKGLAADIADTVKKLKGAEVKKSFAEERIHHGRETREALDELAKARGLPEGTVREWKGKKYKKVAGKWKRHYEGKGAPAKGEEKKPVIDAATGARKLQAELFRQGKKDAYRKRASSLYESLRNDRVPHDQAVERVKKRLASEKEFAEKKPTTKKEKALAVRRALVPYIADKVKGSGHAQNSREGVGLKREMEGAATRASQMEFSAEEAKRFINMGYETYMAKHPAKAKKSFATAIRSTVRNRMMFLQRRQSLIDRSRM
jgi:hypothetical protein